MKLKHIKEETFFRFRVGLHWFVTKPWFDGFIMFVILLSSAALAAEDPVQEDHPRNKLLKIFDYGFTAIFAVECLLKVGTRYFMLKSAKFNSFNLKSNIDAITFISVHISLFIFTLSRYNLLIYLV